jgi:hypothetical protein
MDNQVFEDVRRPRRGHAAGSTSIEQAASQLASDIKYKVQKELKATAGARLSPAQVTQLRLKRLEASPAPGPVKTLARKKLLGENYDYVDVDMMVNDSITNVMEKVFNQKNIDEEVQEARFKIRVTDRATNNTTIRKNVKRAKLDDLKRNPKISVEIISRTDGIDRDGDGKVESSSKEHAGLVHNAIQKATGGNPDGRDTRKEEFIREISAQLSNDEENKEIDVLPKGKKFENKVVINPKLGESKLDEGSEPCEKCDEVHEGKCDSKDERSSVTMVDLVKNRMRAKGIKIAGGSIAPRNMKTAELPPMGEDFKED